MRQLFPEAIQAEWADTAIYRIFAADEELLGYLVETAPYSNEFIGYGGPTPLLIALNAEMVLCGVAILPNDETESFIDYVREEGLFESWNGKTIDQAVTLPVDAISGATLTSEAVTSSLRKRLAMLSSEQFEPKTNWNNWLKDGAALLVILFALFSYFRPAQSKNLRWLLLSSSALVLGVWQGKMLSLATGYNWLINGISLSGQFILVLMLLLSIALPLFTRKPLYCIYLCPYGALQELFGKITKRKLTIPPPLTNYLNKIQPLFVGFIVVGLLLGLSPAWLPEFEPFAAFLIQSASSSVLILAATFLALSIFLHKPWCKQLCPTGYILDFTRTRRTKKPLNQR